MWKEGEDNAVRYFVLWVTQLEEDKHCMGQVLPKQQQAGKVSA